ncbi:hypothetical protein RUM44_009641 [Polyplax serrata]|uniref:Small subunit processome component 20 homolog n=1 Tax=Polyplax serrata TaxID=468196 RepID=A0ABR1AT93_POLSC
MPINAFWDVFFSQLRTATAYCKGMACLQDFSLPDIDDYLVDSTTLVRAEDKPDHENYRNLLWSTMVLFPDICESKNGDIISICLPFLEDEILKLGIEHNLTVNVKKGELTDLTENQENAEDEGAEDNTIKKSYKNTIKCAVSQLMVISKFKNIKKCHREPDVRNCLFSLIVHKDADIQKKALDCIFNYKFSYVTPYKKNLSNLIDDGKFKDELVHFQIDTESGIVKDVHRAELMPLVLRILHSKMMFQSSTPRGNKSSANTLRRSMIFRFLAGISHTEMETFLKMAFKKWNRHCESDVFDFNSIINSVDLEKVPLPKKLQSAINMADSVLSSFGGLMSNDLQRYLLKVLFSVGSFICGILSKRDQIYPGYLLSLKNVRTTCIDFVTKFFDRFQKFPWREDDVNALFHIFIWPNISKLPVEGVHGPTSLLRLFSVWSSNPRYFKLLVRYDGINKKMTPLPFMLDLLQNEKAEGNVTSCIGTILENLLTLEGDESMEMDEDDEIAPLDLENILPIDEEKIEKLTLKEELNYGSKILFPHVGSILKYLRRKLENFDNSTFGKREMTVLSRISEMATSPEHGDALMSLLIKIMTTRKQTNDEEDDVLVNMITTVENLTKVIPSPSSYMRQIAVLFGILELKQARKVLINLVADMEKKEPELKEVGIMVQQLNAWDLKSVDQPDFEKRLDALKNIKSLSDEKQLDTNLAFIVLHNCFYFVRCEPDISLRDSASYCLKEICPKMTTTLKSRGMIRQQWVESILNLIKRGISSDNENVQTLSISLLGVMARECGDFHPVLKDLSILTNKVDPEVDFFENAQHLQIYRRLRALQKFSTTAKTLKKAPLTRTLVQFILPLATRYLACTKYAGKNSLIDSAIEAVATVCRFLPWQQYQMVLRFYLTKLRTKLEFQKQLTRTVIAILDSFHFDISRCSEVSGDATLNKEKTGNEENEDKKPETEGQETAPSGKTEEGRADGDQPEAEKGHPDPGLAEELTDILEKEEENGIEEQEADKQKPEDEKLAIESIIILNPNAARRVETAISGTLLDQLYKIMARKSQIESTHKLNYKSLGPDREEEDLLKVPIAVTVVKLLQKLPERILNAQLPGIFMQLCAFLKSRVESIRRVTRETLQQIIFALGPKYLPLLLGEMSASLTKGFQVHVLVYTIHAVIQHIHDLLKPGDIDLNLPVLLDACKSDLFGRLAEEKEVIKIQSKHKEAKSTKSYHLINLIAQCLTEKCLTDLILPVKEVLQTAYSHKNLVKCREYLRQVSLGLSANQFISYENLFIYVYGTTSESIPQLLPEPPEPEKKKNPKEKPDCFIIPPEPKNRLGVLSNPVKKGSKSTAHIILEFGFGLLHTILKKEKVKNCGCDIRCYLDPIAPILIRSLESQQVKVSTLALQCLAKFIKYDLPSLKAEVKKVTDCLFLILHKYAAAGLCKGNNFDLVLAAFKAISILIRETDYHGITNEQLKILLLYTEQDIYDTSRQATAFTLLRTILRKKLNSPELHELMKKVATLSITSDHSHVRLQARQNVFHYIMDYPLKSKVEDFIGFYTSQLKFDTESGRQSSLDMIKSFILYFPMNKLEELSGVFLLTLGASLINDDSSTCKKTISGLIKTMLTRLDKAHRDQLFDVLMVWFEDNKLKHRRLAAQIAGIYTSVEKEEFEDRLPVLLPLIQKQFLGDSRPGQFVRVLETNAEEDRMKDNHYFQVLQLIMKICTHYPGFLTSDKYQENVYFFTEISQSFLCHAHEWIRCAGAQFLGHVFNSCEPSIVADVLNGKTVESKLSFLESVTIHRRIKSLILDHCAQFIPGIEIGQEFLDQSTKNLVYLARVLSGLVRENEPEKEENEDWNDDDDDAEKSKLTFLWMTKRMRRIVNMELGQSSSSNILRMAVFRWIGAVAMCTSKGTLRSVLYHLMAPVVREREFTDLQQDETPMKTLVTEVCTVLKKKVGVEVYAKEAVKIKTKLMERRMERKNKRAQEFIVDPERAAQRKIERQKKKRESRKRKLEQLRERKTGKFKIKRRRRD